MENKEMKRWYYQRILGEIFMIFTGAWFLLFFLELFKPGVVSNYLSLPHLSLGIIGLGVWYLAVKKQETEKPDNRISSRQKKTLVLVSILLSVFLLLVTDLSLPLTLLLIFVTVASFWVGTAMMFDNDHL